MKLSRRRMLALSGTAVTATAISSFPFAAQAATANWDMADEYNETGLTGKSALNFAQEVQSRAGDALGITYQGGGALGLKSVDHFDAVGDGIVDSAITLVTQLGGLNPLFEMTSLPFLVPDLDAARRLWQISKPYYQRIFDENNMVLLYALPNAPSGIHADKVIDSEAALNGLRIRTYDANGTRTLAAAGAAPLQIAWGDLIPSLSTNAIDAVLTSADGGTVISIWEYLSNYTALNYAMGFYMAHCNKDEFEALPKDVQDALLASGEAADDFNWNMVNDSIEASYAIMEENGMTVTRTPPPEAIAVLQSAADEVVSEWLEKAGDDGKAILDEFRA